MAGRILVAVVALAVASAMAVDVRVERDYEEAEQLLFRDPGEPFAPALADEVERTRERLEWARALRPGTTGILLQAFLESRSGRAGEAEDLAREATRREPDNLGAWQALLTLSRDPQERERARRERARLDPVRAG